MTVHYYYIPNCKLENVEGKPALIAPPDAEPVWLDALDFQQREDGTWFHILTAEERSHIAEHDGVEPVVFGNVNHKSELPRTERLCRLAIRLLISGILLLLPMSWLLLILLLRSSWNVVFPLCMFLGGGLVIAALVILIYVRVRKPQYPKVRAALIFAVVGIAASVSLTVGTLEFCDYQWKSCQQYCGQECGESCGKCSGKERQHRTKPT